MAITATVSKPLNQEYVQVDTTTKKGFKRYYKVPRTGARQFAAELTKFDKNMNILSNTAFFASIFTGAFGAAYLTRKFDSRLKQFLIETASAVTLGIASNIVVNEHIISKEKDLLRRYKAKEIFYKA